LFQEVRTGEDNSEGEEFSNKRGEKRDLGGVVCYISLPYESTDGKEKNKRKPPKNEHTGNRRGFSFETHLGKKH